MTEVKDALRRAASRSEEVVPVFKLFIAMGVVRRELLSMPARESTIFIVNATEVIMNLCVYGKREHADLKLDDPKLVRHLSLFTVYTMMGASAAKVALIEESCDIFHVQIIAKLTCAPELNAFEVCDDERGFSEVCDDATCERVFLA